MMIYCLLISFESPAKATAIAQDKINISKLSASTGLLSQTTQNVPVLTPEQKSSSSNAQKEPVLRRVRVDGHATSIKEKIALSDRSVPYEQPICINQKRWGTGRPFSCCIKLYNPSAPCFKFLAPRLSLPNVKPTISHTKPVNKNT